MAFVIKDRIKEDTSVTGTGDASLSGAGDTFDPFSSVMSNGDTTDYAIFHRINSIDEWEVGTGTYNSSTNAMARTTVLSSSNSGNKVNFSAGVKSIIMTQPASKIVKQGDVVALAIALG